MSAGVEWDSRRRCFLLVGIAARPLPFDFRVSVEEEGGAVVVAATASRGGPEPTRDAGWSFRDGGIAVELRAAAGCPTGVAIEWSLRNVATTPVRLASVEVAAVELGPIAAEGLVGWRLFQNGFQSWTPAGSVPADGVQRYPRLRSFAVVNHWVDSPWWGRRGGLLSSMYAALSAPVDADSALVVGFRSARVGLGEIWVSGRGRPRLQAAAHYGGKRLAPGERVEGEALLVARGPLAQRLDDYASAVGEAMGARVADPSPVGWCSWYELYARVREEDVVANLERVAARPELGIDVVQLDDGYQHAVGDWLEVNRKFPSGLEALAASVRRSGRRAGIWTAPLFAAPRSRLVRRHPDWVLRDRHGRPVDCGLNPIWRTRPWALDLTHPEVEAWLEETFAELAAAGYDYFKLDFLYAGLRAGRHHDPNRSPVEAYRGALGRIRAAVGPQATLVGCGAPLGPSVGLVDAMRVSADVRELWRDRLAELVGRGCGVPSLAEALRNDLTRQHLHRRWWCNDPDCLLVRDRRSRLDVESVRLLTTVIGLTGGSVFVSDDLSRLAEERLEIAAAILPPRRFRAWTPALLDRRRPTRLIAAGAGRRVVALINWDRRPRRVRRRELAAAGELAFDFWRDEPLSGTAAVEVPPRGVRAVVCTADDGSRPRLAGSSLHLTALLDGGIAGDYDADRGELRLTGQAHARRAGSLWVHVPPGWAVTPIELPEGASCETWARRWVRVALRAVPPWTLTLRAERSSG